MSIYNFKPVKDVYYRPDNAIEKLTIQRKIDNLLHNKRSLQQQQKQVNNTLRFVRSLGIDIGKGIIDNEFVNICKNIDREVNKLQSEIKKLDVPAAEREKELKKVYGRKR